MPDTARVVPEIREDLLRLGLQPGHCVVMHSSFRAVGGKEVSPADFLRTLADLLGPDGTLVTPTFTYTYAGIWNVRPFDAATSPGISNGILTETLRQWPGARRSAHPTYSVAALGRHADQITRDKENASALGIGSSYDEAYRLGAQVFLLGVGNDRNSMLHYAEVASGVPYNDIPWRAFLGTNALVLKDGKPREILLPREYPACSMNFGVADEYLEQQGVLKRGKVGQAESILMDAHDMVRVVAERLQREPAWLLCQFFGCEPCTQRRRRLRSLGLI